MSWKWGPEWGQYANDPEHDHMACAICLPERLRIVANVDEKGKMTDSAERLRKLAERHSDKIFVTVPRDELLDVLDNVIPEISPDLCECEDYAPIRGIKANRHLSSCRYGIISDWLDR